MFDFLRPFLDEEKDGIIDVTKFDFLNTEKNDDIELDDEDNLENDELTLIDSSDDDDNDIDNQEDDDDDDGINIFGNWIGDDDEEKGPEKVPKKSHKYVLTYDGFLFQTLLNLDKEQTDL